MKVLYVDQTGELGGGELSLLDIIRYSRHHAEIALFSDGPFRHALEALKVPVHLLPVGQAGQVRREAGLSSILAAMPALASLRTRLASLTQHHDVIYANSQKAFLVSAFARRRGQPLIWHLRDMLTAEHFSPLMRRAAVLAGNVAATSVIANSQATRASFLEAGGNPKKTTVIYNGFSPEPFDRIEQAELETLRTQLGLTGKYVVGVFGRLTSWKGQHVLIDAMAEVAGAHALIVGEALFGESDYAERLRTQARDSGVKDRVHFLGFRRDIPALMKMADVIVHTSTAPEPFGRVIVEAMLAGKPVIATRAGGALEIVVNQETGLLVTPGDAQELARALCTVQSDREFAARLANSGRERAVSHFSIAATLSSIDALVENGGAFSK